MAGLNWFELEAGIKKIFVPGYVIATVWHPEPGADHIHTVHGNARVLVGEPQYQLSTGEIVKL